MTGPACRVQHCAGVADDGTGLCAAHRRSLTLTTKVQDAVREFLRGNASTSSAVRTTRENVQTVERAGTHLAQSLALLISTQFGSDVSYDDQPITAKNLANNADTPWRVSINWRAAIEKETWNEDEELDDDEDDELETAQP